MSENKKLTQEQLKQLQELLMSNMQTKESPIQEQNVDIRTRITNIAVNLKQKLAPKALFMATLQYMDKSVKFVDMFKDFVLNRNSEKVSSVLQNARSPVLFGIYVIVFFVILGGIWAAVAPLDSAAVASGVLMSHGKNQTINHKDGGVIKKIYVRVSDVVKAGDKLIEFDTTRVKSDYENILNQYRTFLAAEHRLISQINGDQKVSYPDFITNDLDCPSVAKIIETQNNLFESRRELKIAERNALMQKTKQLHKQIEGYNAKKISLGKTLEVTKDRLQATGKLSDKGYVQRVDLLELEAKCASIESEIAITDTEIAKSEQEITRTEIELMNLENRFTNDTLNELRDVQLKAGSTREEYLAISDQLERTILKSPVDGVINQIHYNTIGSNIPPSYPILEIYPTQDSLIIKAKLEPKNIDSVTVGLVSKIKFSAFKSRTSPAFLGKVISIAPDIVFDQQPMDPRYAGGYYDVRIELDMEHFDKLAKERGLKLLPGMQAEVQIITGTRTLLRYLLDPLFDAMFKGMKEK